MRTINHNILGRVLRLSQASWTPLCAIFSTVFCMKKETNRCRAFSSLIRATENFTSLSSRAAANEPLAPMTARHLEPVELSAALTLAFLAAASESIQLPLLGQSRTFDDPQTLALKQIDALSLVSLYDDWRHSF